jgi:hypothetical protein
LCAGRGTSHPSIRKATRRAPQARAMASSEPPSRTVTSSPMGRGVQGMTGLALTVARALTAARELSLGSGRQPAIGGSALSRTALLAPLVVALVLQVSPAGAGGRHADPELESLLPTTLGGTALTVESQAGPELATRSAAFDAFLAGLGRTRADFTLASAYSRSELRAEMGGWRVRGADPARLLPAFRAVVQDSSAKPLTQVEEIVAGLAITRIGAPGELARGPLYVLVRADTLLFVQTPDRALAEAAIAKLPP